MGKKSEDEKNAYKSGRGVNGEVCVSGSAWEGSVTKRSSRKWSVMHSVCG
jgi:hypothetical protein